MKRESKKASPRCGTFGKVVESVVQDLIRPLIGSVGGQPDFSAVKLGPLAVANFLNASIAFPIPAAVIFFLGVKPMNILLAMARKMAEEPPAAPAPVPGEVKLLMKMRDLLKSMPV